MSSESTDSYSFNQTVANKLLGISLVLHHQQANPFRVNAYRNAAMRINDLDVDLRELLKDAGPKGLTDLPGIGEGLAATIEEIVHSGRSGLADRINGVDDPESLFSSVPGIGTKTAHAIHETLRVETLEELEVAANDGRLASVSGIGPRRLDSVRNALATLITARRKRGDPAPHARIKAPVAEILDVDTEYFRRAKADDLVRIAPRRFNPDGIAWLPILHTDRLPRHYTALFSNTARANKLNRTRDWVVVYFHDDQHREGQVTVVTETHGKLQGRRVVRGREQECAEYYLATGFNEVKASLGID